MKIIRLPITLLCLTMLFVMVGSCDKTEEDPCLKTKWPLKKTYEIKLAVHISASNPTLSGGTPGSQNPGDFEELMVGGTIEKIKCDSLSVKPVNIGNSYITKGIDWPAPIDISNAYWFGHVVYVYEFENDKDYLDLRLNVKVTMKDGQSYMCNFSKQLFYQEITQMPMEMYHYILLDVYSSSWTKV